MNLRQTPASPASARAPAPAPDPLPKILTLQEAARLTGTSSDVLWQEIRAGRLPFTLVSGRSDTGVLLSTEDLIRVGILRGQPAGRNSVQPQTGGPSTREPQLIPGVPKGGFSPIRIGAYTGTAIVGALALLLVVLLIPSFIGKQSSKTVSSGLSGALDPSCKGQPEKKGCGTGASTHSAKVPSSTTGSVMRPTTRSLSLAPARGEPASPSGTPSGLHSQVSSSSQQPSSAPSAPNPNGYPVPRSIASNCSRDVTSDLIAWIQTVPDNSTLLFSSTACYRIDHTLRIVNRDGLTFSGNGVTFSGKYHTEGKLPHVGVYASKNITFRDVIVRGANPHAGLYEDAYVSTLQWEAAWDIEGSQGVRLDSVQAYDLYGDFVLIQPLWGRPPINSRDITIQNSHFERNGRQGIAITGAQNVTITNNYIAKVRHSMLDLEPEWETLPIDNIRFTGNTTGGVYLLWIANAGKCNAGVSNIYVTDNVMASDAGIPLLHSFPPPGCAARGPFTIERNTLFVRQSPLAALDLTLVHDVMVRSNKVYFDYWYQPRVLVNLKQSTRVSVLDNVVRADPRDKILFVQADPGSDYVSSGNEKV